MKYYLKKKIRTLAICILIILFHHSYVIADNLKSDSSNRESQNDEEYESLESNTNRTTSKRLKNRLSGRDVWRLVIGLTDAGYLKDYNGPKHGEYYIYTTTIDNAFQHFKQDAGIENDDYLLENLFGILNHWDSIRTTMPLGFRELNTETEMAGYDVDELIVLLRLAGFAPEKELLKKNKHKLPTGDEVVYLMRVRSSKSVSDLEKSSVHYIFTEDIKMALKTFQAFHGIEPTGKVDKITVKKLKSYKK